MKGQIFSIDFVLAIAVLSLSLGIALQTMDLAQKNGDVYAQLHSNQAELIAQNWTYNTRNFSNTSPYCLQFSNGSGDCSAFACTENTFTAQRLVECPQGVCLLEVRTCA